MDRITLQGTGLSVSALCMGTANFGVTLDQAQVNAHLDGFMAHGGNFLDTAHVYSNWIPGEKSRSEKMIGQWLRGQRRSDVVLCTKGGHFDFDRADVSRVTPEQLAIDLRESLDYLQTDYIDLYMLHRDNPALPAGEIIDCLNDFLRAGHVRALACSNWTAERIAEANDYVRHTGQQGFAVHELMWSMARVNRDAIPDDYVVMDEEMMRLGQETGMSFMCFSALAKGYFTRRFLGRQLSDELRRQYDNAENDRLFGVLADLPDGAAVTRRCLRYFSGQPVQAVPIVAFSGMEQMMECIAAFEPEDSAG